MKWLHLILIFVLIIIVVISFTKYYADNHQGCWEVETWGKNDNTGQCKHFLDSCIDKGYSTVTVTECDCNNLEESQWGDFKEDCITLKELNS
jgi:hypothetical protein